MNKRNLLNGPTVKEIREEIKTVLHPDEYMLVYFLPERFIKAAIACRGVPKALMSYEDARSVILHEYDYNTVHNMLIIADFFRETGSYLPRRYLWPTQQDLDRLLELDKLVRYQAGQLEKKIEDSNYIEILLDYDADSWQELYWKIFEERGLIQDAVSLVSVQSQKEDTAFNIMMECVPTELKRQLIYLYAGADMSVKSMNFQKYIFVDWAYDKNTKECENVKFVHCNIGKDPFPTDKGIIYIQPGTVPHFGIIRMIPLENADGIIYTGEPLINTMKNHPESVSKSFNALRSAGFTEVILPLEFYRAVLSDRYVSLIRSLQSAIPSSYHIPKTIAPKNFMNVHIFLKAT